MATEDYVCCLLISSNLLQVRRWDIVTGINTETYNGSKAISSVSAKRTSPDIVAFGGSDRVLRLWDSRSRKGESLDVKVGVMAQFFLSFEAQASCDVMAQFFIA
jgi:hypothetical protein